MEISFGSELDAHEIRTPKLKSFARAYLSDPANFNITEGQPDE